MSLITLINSKYFLLFLSVIFIFFTAKPVYAQTSNQVLFQVGNPTDPKPNIGTNPSGKFVYYCQKSPEWNNGNRDMPGSGCGPTSLAMILSSLGVNCGGQTCTPRVVDDVFASHSTGGVVWRADGSDSHMQLVFESSWFRDLGVTAVPLAVPLDLKRAQTLLKDYYILGSVNDHIFVIDQVFPETNEFHMMDPFFCNPQGKNHSNSLPWGGEPWYYAFAIKKT